MKKLIYICLVLFPFSFFGQEEDTSSFTKFDFGFGFSPEYSYRFLSSDSDNQWIVDNYDTLEFSKFGYSFGLNGIYHVSPKLDVFVGLQFADKGEKTKKELTPSLNNYTNHYYYLDIPIRANYFFLDKKVKLYGSAGFSPSVFLNHTIVTKVDGNDTEQRMVDNSTLSKINLAAQLGLGFDVSLTNKWYFKMECLYKQSILSISHDTPVKKYLYGISPTIGFYFHL
jgi:hypothetical protein